MKKFGEDGGWLVHLNKEGDQQTTGPGGAELVLMSGTERIWTKQIKIVQQARVTTDLGGQGDSFAQMANEARFASLASGLTEGTMDAGVGKLDEGMLADVIGDFGTGSLASTPQKTSKATKAAGSPAQKEGASTGIAGSPAGSQVAAKAKAKAKAQKRRRRCRRKRKENRSTQEGFFVPPNTGLGRFAECRHL